MQKPENADFASLCDAGEPYREEDWRAIKFAGRVLFGGLVFLLVIGLMVDWGRAV